MFSRFLLFFGAAGADLVHDSSQNPVLSSTGTTSLGPKAPPASDPIIISPRGKELTTNAPIVPHSSSILIISSRAGPFLPGPFPPCRPGQTRTLCGGKKLRTIFLRHLLRHFLRHLLRHEHVGTMQLKPASEKQSTPSGPPTIRSY